MSRSPGSSLSRYDQELRFLLKVLMVFRVATVTLLLGVAVMIQVKGSQALFFAPLFTVYLLVVSVYLVTIVLASVFNQVRNYPGFASFQIGVDLALFTLILFFTGGHSSPFAFLYLFSILWAALALKGGGYWTASASAILYGGVVDLQYYRLLLPPEVPEMADILLANPWDIMGRVFLHVTAFFAVAFLGHQISRRYRSAREELTERTVDLEKLRSLSDVVFESITSGIAVLEDGGKVRSMNSAAAQMLGLEGPVDRIVTTSEVFKGIPMESLMQKASLRVLNRWEGTYLSPDGEERVLGLSLSPLKYPEKGYVVIFQDLTDLRAMEVKLRTTEKLSAIGRMAASIAHEVRNPLASMSGSIQVLKKDLQLTGEDMHLMDIVLKETERLNDLVGNFLHYERPPSPRFEDVDLKEVVRDTASLLKPSTAGRDIDLVVELPDQPVILSVDVAQMRQIIMNLVRNSIEAIDGKGTIRVLLGRQQATDGGATVLTVSDDGIGIPAEILPEIFEPFKTTKKSGTGLGLAIVYQLVQIHKGSIDVQTRLGEGTSVMIRLAPGRTQ
ncbi:MAG: PAS domain-containing protein [bacterium]|nr:MAG: PAS domain-containing protein [bacterium]